MRRRENGGENDVNGIWGTGIRNGMWKQGGIRGKEHVKGSMTEKEQGRKPV